MSIPSNGKDSCNIMSSVECEEPLGQCESSTPACWWQRQRTYISGDVFLSVNPKESEGQFFRTGKSEVVPASTFLRCGNLTPRRLTTWWSLWFYRNAMGCKWELGSCFWWWLRYFLWRLICVMVLLRHNINRTSTSAFSQSCCESSLPVLCWGLSGSNWIGNEE